MRPLGYFSSSCSGSLDVFVSSVDSLPPAVPGSFDVDHHLGFPFSLFYLASTYDVQDSGGDSTRGFIRTFSRGTLGSDDSSSVPHLSLHCLFYDRVCFWGDFGGDNFNISFLAGDFF